MRNTSILRLAKIIFEALPVKEVRLGASCMQTAAHPPLVPWDRPWGVSQGELATMVLRPPDLPGRRVGGAPLTLLAGLIGEPIATLEDPELAAMRHRNVRVEEELTLYALLQDLSLD